MPAVIIKTNIEYTESVKETFLREVTKALVENAHKNEGSVMVILEKVDGTMGNKTEPMAFIDVRSMVGIDHQTNNDVCAALTTILADNFGISPHRTYIVFTRVPETCWGLLGGISIWDSKTRSWVVNGDSCGCK